LIGFDKFGFGAALKKCAAPVFIVLSAAAHTM
jgi:hypothetical protein